MPEQFNEGYNFTNLYGHNFKVGDPKGISTSMTVDSGYGFTGESDDLTGDSAQQIQLNYPDDIQNQTAYTAFFISIRQSDTTTINSIKENNTQRDVTRFGKNSYNNAIRKEVVEYWRKNHSSSKKSEEQKKETSAAAELDMFNQVNSKIQAGLGTVQQKACIVLPTPKIGAKYSTEWNNDSGLMTQIMNSAAQALSKNEGAVDKAGGLFSNIGKRLAANIVLSNNVVSKTLGVVPNPQRDQYFKDVSFRNFGFSWAFAPRSKKEARNIFNIIKQFKYHMLPRETDDGILWIYPSEFDIVHVWNGKYNPYLPRHTASVLTNVDVDYGDNGLQFMNDGFPAFINLSLSFSELAIVTKKDIEEGY